jgi:two-component system, chemotaxis family, sensor kinase CheA
VWIWDLLRYKKSRNANIIGLSREVMAQKKDGSQFSALLSVSEFSSNGKTFFTGIIRDNTAIKEAELQLQRSSEEKTNDAWLASGVSDVNELIRGNTDLYNIATNVCNYLAESLQLQTLTFYVSYGDQIRLSGGYAMSQEKALGEIIELGSGYVGQAALTKKNILISDIPKDYLQVSTSIGHIHPSHIMVIPLVTENTVYGVIEVASFQEISLLKQALLDALKEPLAVAIRSVKQQTKTQALLDQTKKQAEELQSQQASMQAYNEKLETQQQKLLMSEAELKATNDELQDTTESLRHQKDEINKKNKEVEAKAAELEVSSKYKSEFLANMSHELRTPLNSLLALSDLMARNNEKNLSDKQLKHLDLMCSSGQDLLGVINDILDLSKVEAGQMIVHMEEVLIGYTLRIMKDKCQPLVAEKNIDLLIENHFSDTTSFPSDFQRLTQILKNLLSNAIKFTEQGSVTLRADQAELEGQPAIRFSVIDSGIGIADDKKSAIFEAFQQADGSTTRKYGGTGLGLAISKQMSKLLSGKIQVYSTLGKGSSFQLILPMPAKNREETEQISTQDIISKTALPQPKIGNNMCQGKRLLLVDDDQRNIYATEAMLEELRLEIDTANDGQQALDMINTGTHYDIVLMDMMMPVMSGYESTRRIRQQPEFDNLPVIAFTAKAMVEDRQKCMDAGANDYITKPVDAENLISLIKTWL